MINSNKILGLMVENGYKRKTLAKELGLSYPALRNKLRDKVFTSTELVKLKEIFNIDDINIFFENNCTC